MQGQIYSLYMSDLLDKEELRTEIDARVYHEQKIVLRNRAWLKNLLLIVGLLTCWTIVGL